MVATIRDVDPDRPVLIGLHGASVHADVGLRIDHAAEETDISVMHGYSIYDSLAREPLDPDLVPFTAALTAALAGRPILFEEFGVNTQLPDGPSHWEELPAFYVSPGLTEERMWLYIATGLADAEHRPDPEERIEIVPWPLGDLEGAIDACEDSKSLIGLMALARKLHR